MKYRGEVWPTFKIFVQFESHTSLSAVAKSNIRELNFPSRVENALVCGAALKTHGTAAA
jgi:hypothetical protein